MGGSVKKIVSNPIVQIAVVAAIAVYAPAMLGNIGITSKLAQRAIISVASSMILGAVGKTLAPKIDPPNLELI